MILLLSLSEEVIYNDAVHTQCSTADSTGNQAQSFDDSCITLNNNNQVQEFNILDVLVNSQSRNASSSKQGLSSE